MLCVWIIGAQRNNMFFNTPLHFVLLLIHLNCSIECILLPGHDERRTEVQESGAHCTLKIAQHHFATGSTTAIVQSGLPSRIHFNGALSLYSMMLATFMQALSWTVVVDQADTYTGKVSLGCYK